jgi:Methyltransferase domain
MSDKFWSRALAVLGILNLVCLLFFLTTHSYEIESLRLKISKESSLLRESIPELLKRSVQEEVFDSLTYEFENIERGRNRRAQDETVSFVEEQLSDTPSFPDRSSLLKFAFDSVGESKPNGLIVEFGVGDGGSINFLASLTSSKVHGFDSFEGLPEMWRDGFAKGAFSREGVPPSVRENITLHKGLFSDVLPDFKRRYQENVWFLHIDSDLYSSAKTVLDGLSDRFIPGTIIVFDEFFNYPGWKKGEYLAYMELIEKNPRFRFEYLGYNRGGESVAVRLVSIN